MLNTRMLSASQLDQQRASCAALHPWKSFSGVGEQLATVAAVQCTKFVEKQCVRVYLTEEKCSEKQEE